MTSDQPDPPSPVNEKQENKLDNLITLQQQLQNRIISSFKSSNPASTIGKIRARQVLKRKHPNTQILHHPWPPRLFSVQSLHQTLKIFLQNCLPFFPQNTYYQTTNNYHRTYIDAYSLIPTLSWTSYYYFTNPLALPLYNNPYDIKICQS